MAALLDRRSLLTALGASALLPRIALAETPEAIPEPDREAMVPVEGGRIYVRMNGRIDAAHAPILFVHGGPGGNHAAFTAMLGLAADRAVLMYDQLDSGRSDKPNDPRNWDVDRFVDEIDHIRTAFGLTRLHVCGHSWGGTIALEYGARRPKGLVSTVLASPLISTRSWIADANLLRRQLPQTTQALLDSCEAPAPPPPARCDAATNEFYARFLLRTPWHPEIDAYERARGLGFNAKLYETMWGRTEFVSTGSLKDYDGEPLLAKLDGPHTLFLCGQYDEAQPATVASFAARTPGAEFGVVPGSGHALMLDRRDETLALLRGWLERQDAA